MMKKQRMSYFEENEYIQNLEIRQGFSSQVLSFETRSTYVSIISYFTALKNWMRWFVWKIRNKDALSHLNQIRNTEFKNQALVLGNGPSGEALPKDVLDRFISNGGDLVLCNFFFLNPRLVDAEPTVFVSSDPFIFESPHFERLKEKLFKLNGIRIFVPTAEASKWATLFPKAVVTGFCDMEITQGFIHAPRNIDPRKPRGYSSMTLYKALAMACWVGYEKIFVLGMDNTYPRDIFCNSENQLLQRERHAGEEDYVINRSDFFPSIFDYLYLHSLIFKDLCNFKNYPIWNLDPFSLVDSFPKFENFQKGWDEVLTYEKK